MGSDRDREDAEASEDFISLQSKTQAMGIGDINNIQLIVYTNNVQSISSPCLIIIWWQIETKGVSRILNGFGSGVSRMYPT